MNTIYRMALEGMKYQNGICYLSELYSKLFATREGIEQLFKEDPELKLVVIEGSKPEKDKRKTKTQLELIQGGLGREI